MVKAAKEALLVSKDASIVNVSSIAGVKGVGSSIAYAASKGALNTMTLSMARNLGPIRVNAVCPGFIQGEWLKSGLPEGKKEKPLVLEPIKCHTHLRYKKSCATCRASAGIHHE